ncbi:hypothetical protein MJO10_28165, partial [Salmonella enterica subsp. enterica serovar Anatum]|nr:hypothetical protein [Salmonella enterica subsp. enterica serovar Anatum]
EVVSQADIACYAAKNSGRGRLTVYEPQHALTSSKGMMPLEEQALDNAHTLAAIYHLAGQNYYPGQYEFQCLHGMGEPLYEQVTGKVA